MLVHFPENWREMEFFQILSPDTSVDSILAKNESRDSLTQKLILLWQEFKLDLPTISKLKILETYSKSLLTYIGILSGSLVENIIKGLVLPFLVNGDLNEPLDLSALVASYSFLNQLVLYYSPSVEVFSVEIFQAVNSLFQILLSKSRETLIKYDQLLQHSAHLVSIFTLNSIKKLSNTDISQYFFNALEILSWMLPVEKNRWDAMMSLLESINHISYIALPLEYHGESKELDLHKEKEALNLIFEVEFPILNIVGTFESLGSRMREIFGLSTEVLEEVVQNTLGSLCAVSTVYFNIDMDKEVAFMVDELLKLMSSNVGMNNHYLVTLRIILHNVSVVAVDSKFQLLFQFLEKLKQSTDSCIAALEGKAQKTVKGYRRQNLNCLSCLFRLLEKGGTHNIAISDYFFQTTVPTFSSEELICKFLSALNYSLTNAREETNEVIQFRVKLKEAIIPYSLNVIINSNPTQLSHKKSTYRGLEIVLRDIQHLLSPGALDSLFLYKIFILKAEPFVHGITMIKLMKLYAQENIQFSRKNELVCLLVVMLSEKWVKEKHDELVRSYDTEKLVEMEDLVPSLQIESLRLLTQLLNADFLKGIQKIEIFPLEEINNLFNAILEATPTETVFDDDILIRDLELSLLRSIINSLEAEKLKKDLTHQLELAITLFQSDVK